jgi:hypothetical protein
MTYFILMNIVSTHKRKYIVSSEDSSLNNFNQKPGKEKNIVLPAYWWRVYGSGVTQTLPRIASHSQQNHQNRTQ